MAGLLAVPGCTTKGVYTRVTEVWRTQAHVSLRRLLVVGAWRNAADRRGWFEERTAVALRHAGVPAMSAQALIGDRYPYPRQALVEAAVHNALDGALVIRVVGHGHAARVDVTGPPVGDDPRAQWTDHYRHVYQSEGVEPVRVARAESLLFEVATEALVWSGLSETFAVEDAAEAIASYGSAMAKVLVDGGLLAPGLAVERARERVRTHARGLGRGRGS
ncbi:hypothetical protein [Paraliomyxa miuraensis]|uniref:hypothetical protein n=1 Tax=Paraliomyxa miuraensis TaxID=376150 RepID=UPI0022579BFD|nr:hypothetical protein [Paraliomyxa miuraensis]MCX4240716.1 hypothetical protein [Paraliomyxa miuraensis]